jgi:hypothetical protein
VGTGKGTENEFSLTTAAIRVSPIAGVADGLTVTFMPVELAISPWLNV